MKKLVKFSNLLVILVFFISHSILSQTVPNGSYLGSILMCDNGYRDYGGICVKMTPEEQRLYELQLQQAIASQRNSTFYIDGEEFTLREIESRCEIWRWSDNYGDLECSGSKFNVIERKCEAYFSGEDKKTGELECRGSDFRPIERSCTTSMYSDSYGDISC